MYIMKSVLSWIYLNPGKPIQFIQPESRLAIEYYTFAFFYNADIYLASGNPVVIEVLI